MIASAYFPTSELLFDDVFNKVEATSDALVVIVNLKFELFTSLI